MYSDFFECDLPAYYECYATDTQCINKVFFRIKVSQVEGITYFQVSLIQENQLSKVIKNSTQLMLEVRSKEVKHEPVQYVEPMSTLHFAQCYPRTSSILLIGITDETGRNVVVQSNYLNISPEPEYFEWTERGCYIKVVVKFIGEHTVIDVGLANREDLTEYRRRQKNNHSIQTKFAFNQIGLSVIKFKSERRRVELYHATFSNLFAYIEAKGENFSDVTLAGFLTDFQVDNNSNSTTNNPVILRKAAGMTEAKRAEQRTLVNWTINLENPRNSSHLYLKSVEVTISRLEAFVEEEYLDEVLSHVKNIAYALHKGKIIEEQDFIKRKYFDDFLSMTDDNFDLGKRIWEIQTLDEKNNFVFIRSFSVSKIKLYVNYFQDPSSTIDKDFELKSLIGVAVGGFEDAKIELEPIHQE